MCQLYELEEFRKPNYVYTGEGQAVMAEIHAARAKLLRDYHKKKAEYFRKLNKQDKD